VRREDIACQGTQGLVGERSERLGTSDKGVILLRRLILDGVNAVQEGQPPKGVLTEEHAGDVIKIDSFTGIRGANIS
jgi:hypothetical protein